MVSHAGLQRAAQDRRGAAAAREVHLRDDGAGQGHRHHPLAHPPLPVPAGPAGRAGAVPRAALRQRGRAGRLRRAAARRARRRRLRARLALGARPARSPAPAAASSTTRAPSRCSGTRTPSLLDDVVEAIAARDGASRVPGGRPRDLHRPRAAPLRRGPARAAARPHRHRGLGRRRRRRAARRPDRPARPHARRRPATSAPSELSRSADLVQRRAHRDDRRDVARACTSSCSWRGCCCPRSTTPARASAPGSTGWSAGCPPTARRCACRSPVRRLPAPVAGRRPAAVPRPGRRAAGAAPPRRAADPRPSRSGGAASPAPAAGVRRRRQRAARRRRRHADSGPVDAQPAVRARAPGAPSGDRAHAGADRDGGRTAPQPVGRPDRRRRPRPPPAAPRRPPAPPAARHRGAPPPLARGARDPQGPAPGHVGRSSTRERPGGRARRDDADGSRSTTPRSRRRSATAPHADVVARAVRETLGFDVRVEGVARRAGASRVGPGARDRGRGARAPARRRAAATTRRARGRPAGAERRRASPGTTSRPMPGAAPDDEPGGARRPPDAPRRGDDRPAGAAGTGPPTRVAPWPPAARRSPAVAGSPVPAVADEATPSPGRPGHRRRRA